MEFIRIGLNQETRSYLADRVGGRIAAMETDSAMIVSTKDGGVVPCAGGPHRLENYRVPSGQSFGMWDSRPMSARERWLGAADHASETGNCSHQSSIGSAQSRGLELITIPAIAISNRRSSSWHWSKGGTLFFMPSPILNRIKQRYYTS